ncbi:MAG: GrpB family protein, partial [Acidimicrobiales bacterium]
PYDPGWRRSFETERDRIEPALRPWLARPVEHIGSTSIPGMAAKAIIRHAGCRGRHRRCASRGAHRPGREASAPSAGAEVGVASSSSPAGAN